MKVWELIAKLSECPAGADVMVGLYCTNVVEMDEAIYISENYVILRSQEDVNVVCTEPIDDVPLSKLVESYEDNFLREVIEKERIRHDIQPTQDLKK